MEYQPPQMTGNCINARHFYSRMILAPSSSSKEPLCQKSCNSHQSFLTVQKQVCTPRESGGDTIGKTIFTCFYIGKIFLKSFILKNHGTLHESFLT
jgi:hypothetical protein